jgi:hypothetical protein
MSVLVQHLETGLYLTDVPFEKFGSSSKPVAGTKNAFFTHSDRTLPSKLNEKSSASCSPRTAFAAAQAYPGGSHRHDHRAG